MGIFDIFKRDEKITVTDVSPDTSISTTSPTPTSPTEDVGGGDIPPLEASGGGGGGGGGGTTPTTIPTPTTDGVSTRDFPTPAAATGQTEQSIRAETLANISRGTQTEFQQAVRDKRRRRDREPLVFLKKREAEERGIVGFSSRDGEASRGQQAIIFTESFKQKGMEKGGAFAVRESQLNIQPVRPVQDTIRESRIGQGTDYVLGAIVGVPLFKEAKKGLEIVPAKIGKIVDVSREATPNILRQDSILFGNLPRQQTYGFLGESVGTLVPTTTKDVILTGALVTGATAGAKVVRAGIGTLVTTGGTVMTFDKSLTAQERFAGGLIAVGGLVGTAGEIAPYIRGVRYKYASGRYRDVIIREEGFRAIEKGIMEKDIALIPSQAEISAGISKDVKLPKTSAIKSGADVLTKETKYLYKGDKPVTTSQIGLLKGESGKITLTRELYGTPTDTSGILQTRITRLGIQDMIKQPKDIQIGFGLPKEPQIIVDPTGKYWKLGTGIELEKTFIGTIGFKRIGVSVLKGEGVGLYQIEPIKTGRGQKGIKTATPSSRELMRVSGETLISASISTPTFSSGKTYKTGGISTVSYPSTSISYPIGSISTPTTTPTGISTGLTGISTPLTTLTPPTTTPTGISTPVTFPTPPPPPTRFKTPTFKIPKSLGTFGVSVRRRGVFKPIGTGLTLGKAISVGSQRVQKTIAASFKITPEKKGTTVGGFRTPKGFKRKKGLIFIEKPSLRLSTPTEIKQIQIAKGGIKI